MSYKKLGLFLQKILHVTSSLPLEEKTTFFNYVEHEEKVEFFTFEN